MEVTRKNFKEALVLIKEAIDNATFIAIDTELTGLHTAYTCHAFDTPEERYHKIKEGADKFQLIQFGLSAFQYHSQKEKYTHKDYSIYVFPHQFSGQGPDVHFLCQASSLDFLASNGFDFNKLIRDGISYLTPPDEQKLRERMEERHNEQKEMISPLKSTKNSSNGPAKSPPINIPEEFRSFVEDIHTQIRDLLSSEKESISFAPCNAFLRKIIYQSLREKYNEKLDITTKVNEKHERYIVATKATEEQRQKMVLARQTEEMAELEEAVGLRRILELVSQSGKLVVGHNLMLDLLHTLCVFSSPLPESYEDFKIMANCIFPRIFDTKLMASVDPFREYFTSTGLSNLLGQLQGKAFKLPQIEPADGFKGYELNDEHLHDAGYDAFITGVCLIGLANRLGFIKGHQKKCVLPDSPYLEPYINKLYLMKHYDIQYLNLGGLDLNPSRDFVFHVSFPKEWRSSDICQLFSVFGPVYISWLNETSALVALKKPEQAPNVKKTLVKEKSEVYRVRTYYEYMEKQRILSSPLIWDRKPQPVPQVDLNLPAKRRRSNSTGSLEHVESRHSIDPIPEEEEEEETEEKDMHEAKKQKMCVSEQENKGSCTVTKLFEESENWS